MRTPELSDLRPLDWTIGGLAAVIAVSAAIAHGQRDEALHFRESASVERQEGHLKRGEFYAQSAHNDISMSDATLEWDKRFAIVDGALIVAAAGDRVRLRQKRRKANSANQHQL